MKKPPFFSVIIPTFNRSYCIQDAINSVLNQSFVDFELIVIDDASLDDTELILENFKDSGVKYFKNPINKGQSTSLNNGALKANGKYLCFLDSDDLWEKDFLLSFHNEICDFPKHKCFYCWLNTENGIYRKWYLEGNIYKEVLLIGELSSTITLVVSKEAFMQVNGFDELLSFGNDDDICFRLSKQFEFKLIPKPLAKSRAIDTNAMTKNSISLAKGKGKLLEKYKHEILKLLGKKVLSWKYYELSNNYLLAGDISNFKMNLMTALRLRFENYPQFFHRAAFQLIFLYKYPHVRKSL